jgi:hypothetical protein
MSQSGSWNHGAQAHRFPFLSTILDHFVNGILGTISW